jgi:hypothetical protein
MFPEYNIMCSLSLGCVDGVARAISDVLKSKEIVFVLMFLNMCDEVVLWLFILRML